ncbi:MAG: Do family serine endopeptidase [Prevotellaceae bacterium]|jgi:Do/DeqQ family serine protease|nr:Do family serine endopeptidase [Prevotellaceae bacterium]
MKKNSILKTISLLLFAGIIGGFISALIIKNINSKNPVNINYESQPMRITTAAFSPSGEPVSFSDAAEHTVPSVVHVKVSYETQYYKNRGGNDIFDFFFGMPDAQKYKEYTPKGSGSGVIISADGYIITNNHVIDKASEVKVTLDDQTTLDAEIVGRDPNTDIALLKVETDKKLQALTFGNSDDLRLGEWVLAVGNPFNLTSTITAGIVSAKARQLNMIPGELSIESFIQTDAAVNPGNSGGALVNLKGELVGINTAIATNTGVYEGFSFAVPSSIVKKVIEDLIQYGKVQRAFLGIMYMHTSDIDEEVAEKNGITNLKELQKYRGAYVESVKENSAAHEAGIQKGDIIIKIENKDVTSKSIVVEEISRLRPGDKLNLTLVRDGKTKQISTVLRNNAGNTEMTSTTGVEVLGAKLEPVSKELAQKLKIDGGLQVTEIYDGKLKDNGVRKGFIILKVNQRGIVSEKDLVNVLKDIKKGGVFIEGVYPNGYPAYIAFGL